jgi:glutamyl-tRNA synthetase
MSVSGALFDMVKLMDVSKIVISGFTAEKVYEESLKWAEKFDSELVKLLENKEYSLKVLGIERGNKKPRKDIAKWSDVKQEIEYMYDEEFNSKEQNYEWQVITDKEKIKEILSEYIKVYNENNDKQEWFDTIKNLAGKLGYASEVKEYKANPDAYPGHVGDVSTVLRIALTGRTNTPDMYEIMQIIGKERMEERFNKILNK